MSTLAFTYEPPDLPCVFEVEAEFVTPAYGYIPPIKSVEITGTEPWPILDMSEEETNAAIDSWLANHTNYAKLEEKAAAAWENQDEAS